MRISDWSSDVCSSDLAAAGLVPAFAAACPRCGEQPVLKRAVIRLLRVAAHLDPLRLAARELEDRGQRIAHLPLDHEEDRIVPEIEIGRASCRERVCQYG